MDVDGPYSKIQIVKPLTKEAISKGNKGGGNWGARNGANINQIEIIEMKDDDKMKNDDADEKIRILKKLQDEMNELPDEMNDLMKDDYDEKKDDESCFDKLGRRISSIFCSRKNGGKRKTRKKRKKPFRKTPFSKKGKKNKRKTKRKRRKTKSRRKSRKRRRKSRKRRRKSSKR